jgi:excinuclease UvrABC ATPase subunit
MEENELFPCNKCNGEGKFLVPGKQIDEHTYMAVYKICEKCHGTGELDWIEEIRGKRLSIAKRILSQHKILEELKKRVANEHQQKLQAFYEGCVPV